MRLALGHNAVMPVRLEPATPRSRVNHSTTEPLRSLLLESSKDSNNYHYGAQPTSSGIAYHGPG